MFPAMRVKITGLDPHQQYYIAMDIVPVDNKRYRWAVYSQYIHTSWAEQMTVCVPKMNILD